ncbi:MAG TPA: hypothetical protein K8V32_09690 [Enteractinococcus helveticum]|uniref:Uncharacterized protein n=1 Tax=Enteractinococcus helveticum TaxID=1837282 RepID=A0A921FNF5_9MICC|nr:hypothetical protein [Enteractinococcus helveticum]HJF15055.1 hypothetical protein [Enteractinococcus helveticum]
MARQSRLGLSGWKKLVTTTYRLFKSRSVEMNRVGVRVATGRGAALQATGSYVHDTVG